MRIRSNKPEFWRHSTIASLPRDLRLLVIGLWSYVDDNGVGVDDFRLVASDLFGMDDDPREAREWVREGLATLSRVIDEASGQPLLLRYTVDGKRYLFPTTFVGELGQRVDRPNKPRYPLPDNPRAVHETTASTSASMDPRDSVASASREVGADVASGTEEQGNRGTGQDLRAPAAPPPQPGPFTGLFAADSVAEPVSPNTAPVKEPERGSDADPDFVKFWSVYPLKKAKDAARKAWRGALRKKGVEPGDVIAGAERYRDDPARKPDFTAHASTWLNAGRWADEASPPPSRNGHRPYRDPDPSAYDGDL